MWRLWADGEWEWWLVVWWRPRSSGTDLLEWRTGRLQADSNGTSCKIPQAQCMQIVVIHSCCLFLCPTVLCTALLVWLFGQHKLKPNAQTLTTQPCLDISCMCVMSSLCSVLFCLPATLRLLSTPASKMTFIVSGGALNSTQSTDTLASRPQPWRSVLTAYTGHNWPA